MEYRYATEIGKPVIAFLHENPGILIADRTENAPEAREQLSSFRSLCESKVVKYWNGPQSLGSAVSRSIVRLIKDRPTVGWVRGSAIASDEANREILRLREKVDELQAKLRGAANSKPEGTENLLQDDDLIPSEIIVKLVSEKNQFQTSTAYAQADVPWSAIWEKVSPRLIDELSEADLEKAVDEAFVDSLWNVVVDSDRFKKRTVRDITSTTDGFHKIKIQLVALGLIMRGDKKRGVNDTKTYWKLTPYGETKMMKSLAMRKPESADLPAGPSIKAL